MRSRFAEALGLDPAGIASLLLGQPTALGLGFLASIVTVILLSRREGFRTADSAELLLAAYLGALVVGRLLDMAWWGMAFLRQPWRIVDPWFGGVSTLGGLVGATLATVFWARRQQLDALRFLDAAAPAAGLTVAFLKSGCFLAGCCYGERTAGALGVRFPPSSLVYYDQLRTGLIDGHYHTSLPVFPVQAYEAALGLLVFGLLLILRRPLRAHRGASLFVGALLLLGGRFALEALRAPRGATLLGASGAQVACVVAAAALLAIALRASWRHRLSAWLGGAPTGGR